MIMNIDERIKALFALEEAIDLCKEHKLLPPYKMGYLNKVVEELIEVIIETAPHKLGDRYE